jgi:subtilase family serine protease
VTTTNGGPWSDEYGWPYSGGGVPPTADSYAQPSWQAGVGNASNGVSTTKRSDPDVASEADFEMLGCEADVCEDAYGGTSYAAPTWAAIFAMVNQASVAAGNGTVGFVNPQLYAAGENATYQNVFHDVTGCGGIDSGEETGPDCNSSDEGTPVQGYNPVTGYDGVTGWGSPNVTNLVTELTVPTLVIAGCGAGCDRASSITFTINFPELSGTSTFTATPSGSMTATTIGTCTMASSTCSLTVLGSAIGVGTFTIQTYYADTRTTPTTNRYSATQIITIAADATNTAVTANPSTIPSTSSTSLTATVTDTTITNTVPAGTVNFSEGATALGSCTLSGGTCSITVSGSTLGVGTDTVTATYVPGSNLCGASSGTTTVTVTASGAITFSSVNHNMGSETIGSTSSAYGVEMTNTSSTTVTYTGITISTSASPNPFKMVTNCGTSLAAGKNCEIEFTYAPVSGDSGTETATWSLAGTPNGTTFSPSNGGTLTGTVASSGSVTLTTAGHNFGDQTVGTTSGTYGTVLTNSTNAAITLTKGSVTSPFNSITNCGTTLAAGASCNLDFTFSPTTTGLVQQVYSLSANGGAVPILVGGNPTTGITLTGTGD